MKKKKDTSFWNNTVFKVKLRVVTFEKATKRDFKYKNYATNNINSDLD